MKHLEENNDDQKRAELLLQVHPNTFSIHLPYVSLLHFVTVSMKLIYPTNIYLLNNLVKWNMTLDHAQRAI